MNINTTSTYTYGSSSSKGMSGLVSGLDTESLVKEMLSGTQSKIDAQKALKQQTEWKQEIYRDLIGSINSLQSKYFSSSASSSLMSSDFYNMMSVASASKNFSVSASTSAAVGNTSLEIHQLAANHSISSSAAVSGKLAGIVNSMALQELADAQRTGDRRLDLLVSDGAGNESKVSIDLKRFFVEENGRFSAEIDSDAIAKEIQTQLKEQGGLDAEVAITDGRLSIVSTDMGRWFSVAETSSELALNALGLKSGAEARANTAGSQRSLTGVTNLEPAVSFSMTLDDSLQKAIRLDVRELVDANGTVDIDKLQAALTASINRQFGAGTITVERTGDTLEIAPSIGGRKVTVESGGDPAVLEALGLKSGQGNRIGVNGRLQDLMFSSPLQGDRFRFSINGVNFTFNGDDTIQTVISKINSPNAGVTIAYKPLNDAFVMMTKESGAGNTIELSQTEGNLLNTMFGSAYGELKNGGAVASTKLTLGFVERGDLHVNGVKAGKLSLRVNGQEYMLEVGKKSDGSSYTHKELLDQLNRQLLVRFGTAEKDGKEVQNIEFRDDGTLAVRNGALVEFTCVGNDLSPAELDRLAGEGNLSVALGFAEGDSSNNLVQEENTLEDAGLAFLADHLGLSKDTKLSELQELTKGMDVQFALSDGRLTVSAGGGLQTLSFDDAERMKALFGVDVLSLNAAEGRKAAVVEGCNAVVRIDGVLTERSSNVFTYNGLTVELKGLSAGKDEEMAGTVYEWDADGNLKPLSLQGDNWIDANGYLRSGSGGYIQADMATETDDRALAKRYTDLVYRDSEGNSISGVGINADGKLLDSSGNVLKARESENISVTRDTDKIVEGVKDFIDNYNKLVETINGYLNEEANYRDYAPLTDEQRAEMTEKQIELWDKKAKEGLLRRDSTLDSFLQSMRSIWYETNSSGYAIYQLGIETGEWSTRGQLVLSADGETMLRQMVASDPNGVMNFFTNQTDGAATRINELLKGVANPSSGSPGTLVQMAGIKGMASEKSNTLYEQLRRIENRIEQLNKTYKQEKERYWNQFNAMEKALANMNTQSMWLTQQFA